MVSSLTNFKIKIYPFFRHASIDAATRAARGLPEDLIRLCVGIEDPYDLLDDLERALIDAGAIALDPVENKYVKLQDNDALSLAVRKLQLDGASEKEWFISAPGKVILFGEHAVVHGVVSHFLPSGTGTSYGYTFIGGAFIDHNNGIACTGISKCLMKSN